MRLKIFIPLLFQIYVFLQMSYLVLGILSMLDGLEGSVFLILNYYRCEFLTTFYTIFLADKLAVGGFIL